MSSQCNFAILSCQQIVCKDYFVVTFAAILLPLIRTRTSYRQRFPENIRLICYLYYSTVLFFAIVFIEVQTVLKHQDFAAGACAPRPAGYNHTMINKIKNYTAFFAATLNITSSALYFSAISNHHTDDGQVLDAVASWLFTLSLLLWLAYLLMYAKSRLSSYRKQQFAQRIFKCPLRMWRGLYYGLRHLSMRIAVIVLVPFTGDCRWFVRVDMSSRPVNKVRVACKSILTQNPHLIVPAATISALRICANRTKPCRTVTHKSVRLCRCNKLRKHNSNSQRQADHCLIAIHKVPPICEKDREHYQNQSPDIIVVLTTATCVKPQYGDGDEKTPLQRVFFIGGR